MKAKYYSSGDLLAASRGSSSSWGWKGIHSVLPYLRQGLVWQIGACSGLSVWFDRWVGPFRLHDYVVQPLGDTLGCLKVGELFDRQSLSWR